MLSFLNLGDHSQPGVPAAGLILTLKTTDQVEERRGWEQRRGRDTREIHTTSLDKPETPGCVGRTVERAIATGTSFSLLLVLSISLYRPIWVQGDKPDPCWAWAKGPVFRSGLKRHRAHTLLLAHRDGSELVCDPEIHGWPIGNFIQLEGFIWGSVFEKKTSSYSLIHKPDFDSYRNLFFLLSFLSSLNILYRKSGLKFIGVGFTLSID